MPSQVHVRRLEVSWFGLAGDISQRPLKQPGSVSQSRYSMPYMVPPTSTFLECKAKFQSLA